MLLLLEGGYDLTALAESVTTSVAHLREPQRFDSVDGELTPWARLTRESLSPYWKDL
jgi:acetoin utilization deacetylase AcuC-like enzyme